MFEVFEPLDAIEGKADADVKSAPVDKIPDREEYGILNLVLREATRRNTLSRSQLVTSHSCLENERELAELL